MTTLYYSRGKLIFSGAFLLILAPVLGLFSLFAGPVGMIIGVILIVGGPLMSIGRLARVFGDLRAVEYDERQITLYPIGAQRRLDWRQVASIEVETLTQYIYGFIPVNRQHSIQISHAADGRRLSSINIPFNLLNADKAAIMARMTHMEMLRSRAGEAAAARAVPQGMVDEAEPSDFDADAVMARYLARRGEQQAKADEPARPQMPPRVAGFGRKRA